jgi:glycosyltransferase involved in cell wall biosynthesis
MIAYVAYWNEFAHSGVWNKITAQVGAWAKIGEAVDLHIVTRGRGPISAPEGVKLIHYPFRGLREKLSAWSLLAANVRSAAPSCVYFRYDVPALPILNLANTIPLIVEANTNDRVEYRRPISKRVLNEIGRNLLYERAAGIVLVSAELSECLPEAAKSIPTIVIGNSIDLERIPLLPPSVNVKPNFLFVASHSHPWQGLDKVIALARALKQSVFHIVGDIDCPGAPENVVFHGALSRIEITNVAGACDVGIGTLALHRRGGTEACPLKVREYLALGLPVVLGYDDTDFPLPQDFILKVPNSEAGPLEASASIQSFGEKWVGRRVPRERIEHIGTLKKEALRVEFMRLALSHHRAAQAHNRTLK